jgi:hypothetical protein
MKRAAKDTVLTDITELDAAQDDEVEAIEKVHPQSAGQLECAEAIRKAILDSDPLERTFRE